MSQAHPTTPDPHPVNRNACRRIAEKNPLLRAARYYTLHLDLPVFPLHWTAEGACSCGNPQCSSPGKHPLTPNGFKDATTHELAVCQWWKDAPASNLGLPTGQRSGLFVLDVDPKNGGLESLAKLPELPPTRMVRTPSGGFHFYFKWQDGLTNRNAGLKQYGPGLDARGEGGYVVVPPSIIDGKRYEWMNEEDPAELPAWLLELLIPPPASPPRNPVERRLVSASQLIDPRRAKAANTLIERAEALSEGERNDGTFRYAAALREVAASEEEWEEYRARLLDVLPYGNGYGPAFTEAEAERTIRSAEGRVVLGAWQPTMSLELAGAKAVKEQAGLQVTWATDIEVKPLDWLWPNYIPLGALGILAGAPKVGKSAVAVDLAARVTTGRAMPDGSFSGVKGRVLMVAPEDGPDGAKVRFMAAGGDLASFGLLWADADVPPSFPDDTSHLERLIRAYDVRLVVIDNLDAVAGRKLDMNKAKDVTEMLAPLQAVAKRSGAAILAIEHTRKGGTGNPLDNVLGSRKVTGEARFVAFVLRNQDDPAERLFGVYGNYAAEDDGTLRFTLESAGDDARGLHVAWQGEANVSLSNAMLAGYEPPDSALGEAKAFLREVLASGPVASENVRRDALERDIAISTLKRARQALGIKPEQISTSTGRATYWQLPTEGQEGGRLKVESGQVKNRPLEPMNRSPLSSTNVSTTGGSGHPPSYGPTPGATPEHRCPSCSDWLPEDQDLGLCPRCEEEGTA
jgi:putative DNA primase/helicase